MQHVETPAGAPHDPLVYRLVDDGLHGSLRGQARGLDPHALDDEPVLATNKELPRQGPNGLEELVEVEGPESPGLD